MTSDLDTVRAHWQAAWPAALDTWSKFTRLSEPRWCYTAEDEKREGLTASFAMIRLDDHAVVISLKQIAELGLANFAPQILAHEIGHHVYTPADLTDHARMIARMRWGLPTKEHLANLVSNLYTDLLINDRLQRSANLRMDAVYVALGQQSTDAMWTFYMRIYEILWSLPRNTLARGDRTTQQEGDAQLGARLIRAYARDWLDGAGRFAALCFPYLEQGNGTSLQKVWRWHDTQGAMGQGFPSGLIEMESDERAGAIHPARDPALSGLLPEDNTASAPPRTSTQGGTPGQAREPFELGEILRTVGLNLNPLDLAVRYYRERAAPYLIPFPSRVQPESPEPQPEGLEPWDIGAPLEHADWFESVLVSPRIIPGMTTVQRVYGTTEGAQPKREPLDLDIYVDSSGSMPNPQHNLSYLTLAGAIVALSALRVGARVQATLWSGKKQFITTAGFVRDSETILKVLAGYFGGATAFPIHILRETYAQRRPTDRATHILHISDDGITTMFEKDERGHSGWDIAAQALHSGRGGGTMVLNLWQPVQKNPDLVKAQQQGWRIHVVRQWEELLAFARAFSQQAYGDSAAVSGH